MKQKFFAVKFYEGAVLKFGEKLKLQRKKSGIRQADLHQRSDLLK